MFEERYPPEDYYTCDVCGKAYDRITALTQIEEDFYVCDDCMMCDLCGEYSNEWIDHPDYEKTVCKQCVEKLYNASEKKWAKQVSLYDTPPSDRCFNELKEMAFELWESYRQGEETNDYVNEKIDRIKNLENVKDNFMYIFAMFDWANQRRLLNKCSVETQLEIEKRCNNYEI